MLNKNNLEKKLDVQIATSTVMDNSIQLWLNMYKNLPPWIGGEAHVKSLNLPSTIAEEFARLTLTEFDLQLDGSERAEYLLGQMNDTLTNMSNIVEMWCALGGIALKPYVAENDEDGTYRINIDVVAANRFYPTAFDSNKRVTGAVFIDTKQAGDYLYTRLEYHSLDGKKYTIKNKAFRSERLYSATTEDDQINVKQPFSQEISLEQVDDWKGIEPVVEIDDVEQPFFVYIRTPRANNIDPLSPLGASVYAKARDLIEEADRQFSRTLWEYEAKEAAIDADETLFTTDKKGNPVLPTGRERLYRTYDTGTGGNNAGFLKAYSPDIRDTSMFNGLDKLYRSIEFLCGLAYGTLSETRGSSDAAKTATEIISSKQRSYMTVKKMQDAWEDGLDALLTAMNELCDLYNIVPDGKVEKTITWGDGVMEDTNVEYQRRWAMVIAGKMKLEKFYAWYFGCSEEQAIEYIPDAIPQFPEDK